jgi:beta-lactamase regulating signal transducer with metallopeptidase domain
MYLTQSVAHSIIAVILVELSFYAWEIRDHLAKFRYRLLVISLPVVMFPVFQVINPDRGSLFFRSDAALFDSQKWFSLELFSLVPVYVFFLAILALTVLLFFFQEIFPIAAETISKSESPPIVQNAKELDPVLDDLCRKVGVERPAVVVLDEDYPVLFTEGMKKHTIMISVHLLRNLSEDELRSALIHEIIHMKRSSSIKMQAIYVLRILMFYNPVSLVEFRRLVHDDEFICDRIAVSISHQPAALIRAIEAFFSHPEIEDAHGILSIQDRLARHSHNVTLAERIRRIREEHPSDMPRFNWAHFLLTASAIVMISYSVV